MNRASQFLLGFCLASVGLAIPKPLQTPVYLGYQDSLGQYSFGYSGPESARSEVRESNGQTRGSFSYVDGDGFVQSAEYTADGEHGFRIAATNLPQAVEDTPEVVAARAAHFQALRLAYEREQQEEEILRQYGKQQLGQEQLTQQVGQQTMEQLNLGQEIGQKALEHQLDQGESGQEQKDQQPFEQQQSPQQSQQQEDLSHEIGRQSLKNLGLSGGISQGGLKQQQFDLQQLSTAGQFSNQQAIDQQTFGQQDSAQKLLNQLQLEQQQLQQQQSDQQQSKVQQMDHNQFKQQSLSQPQFKKQQSSQEQSGQQTLDHQILGQQNLKQLFRQGGLEQQQIGQVTGKPGGNVVIHLKIKGGEFGKLKEETSGVFSGNKIDDQLFRNVASQKSEILPTSEMEVTRGAYNKTASVTGAKAGEKVKNVITKVSETFGPGVEATVTDESGAIAQQVGSVGDAKKQEQVSSESLLRHQGPVQLFGITPASTTLIVKNQAFPSGRFMGQANLKEKQPTADVGTQLYGLGIPSYISKPFVASSSYAPIKYSSDAGTPAATYAVRCFITRTDQLGNLVEVN